MHAISVEARVLNRKTLVANINSTLNEYMIFISTYLVDERCATALPCNAFRLVPQLRGEISV